MTFATMCALRIYLKKGDNHSERGFFRRLLNRPLSTQLLQLALKAGVTHASVSLGHMGYVRGSKQISMDVAELSTLTLPVCLELVAPKPLLEQFVRDHAKLLANGTLVMLEGVHVASALEPVPAQAPHHVEYMKAGGVVLPVDHVALEPEQSESTAK